MEDNLYSNLGTKLKKTRTGDVGHDDHLTLNDVDKLVTRSDIIKAFCNDLRKLLLSNDIHQIIQGIFAIESNMACIYDEFHAKDLKDLPSLNDLYIKLSPILLRALWENFSQEDLSESMTHTWSEALKIALEEQFYIWQEKVI